MLGVGIESQFAGTLAVYAPMFLISQLHLHEGVGLADAALVAAAPRYGSLLTILAWGVVVDRFGERFALVSGFAVASFAYIAAISTRGLGPLITALFFVGVGGACVNAASGRVVAFAFPAGRRGLVMGIRQSAQPLGIAAAAVSVPALAVSLGTRTALVVPAVACALTALLCAGLVGGPPRRPRSETREESRGANPYLHAGPLLRLHLSSGLLMVPQIAIWTFGVLWLVERWGWSPTAAGGLVAFCQVAGAVARISAGAWSDRLGSRLLLMRRIAFTSALTMALLAATQQSMVSIALLAIAATVTLADNGLGLTAVAEAGGQLWGGRAIGVHSTGQLVVSSIAPSALEIVLSSSGYGLMFGVVAVLPAMAMWTLPLAWEGRLRATAGDP
jgi:nitrate/nitrite transporter NarK